MTEELRSQIRMPADVITVTRQCALWNVLCSPTLMEIPVAILHTSRPYEILGDRMHYEAVTGNDLLIKPHVYLRPGILAKL